MSSAHPHRSPSSWTATVAGWIREFERGELASRLRHEVVRPLFDIGLDLAVARGATKEESAKVRIDRALAALDEVLRATRDVLAQGFPLEGPPGGERGGLSG